MSNTINTNQFVSQLQGVNNSFANFTKPNTFEYTEGEKAKPLAGKDAMSQFMNDIYNAGSNRVTRFG